MKLYDKEGNLKKLLCDICEELTDKVFVIKGNVSDFKDKRNNYGCCCKTRQEPETEQEHSEVEETFDVCGECFRGEGIFDELASDYVKRCDVCEVSLSGDSFFEYKGQVLCQDCFYSLFAKNLETIELPDEDKQKDCCCK